MGGVWYGRKSPDEISTNMHRFGREGPTIDLALKRSAEFWEKGDLL